MTLRRPPELEAELRTAAAQDHRSMQQQIRLAVEARVAVAEGDVVYGASARHSARSSSASAVRASDGSGECCPRSTSPLAR